MRLLAKKWKNFVFSMLIFGPYLNNLSHQGCENALKVSVEYFTEGQSTILELKKKGIMFKGQKFVLQA